MNNVRKFIVASAALALSAVAVVNTPMAASPDATGPKSGLARGRMHGGLVGGAPLITIALDHKSDLNLSPEQIANLEKIRSHYQSQATPAHQQLMSVEKEIASLTRQTPANLVQIKERIQQAEKERSELRYLRIEALENGRSVLTAQQQDQLKTIIRSLHRGSHGPQGQPS